MTDNEKLLIGLAAVAAAGGALYFMATRQGVPVAAPASVNIPAAVSPASPGYQPATFNFNYGSPTPASYVNPGSTVLFNFTPPAPIAPYLPGSPNQASGAPSLASADGGVSGSGCGGGCGGGCGSSGGNCPGATTASFGSLGDLAAALGPAIAGLASTQAERQMLSQWATNSGANSPAFSSLNASFG